MMRISRLRIPMTYVEIAAYVVAVLALALVIISAVIALFSSSGCATVGVAPKNPICNPSSMLRYGDTVYQNIYDCYTCIGAAACSPHGNDWCCRYENNCYECDEPLVSFGRERPVDGGVDGGVR